MQEDWREFRKIRNQVTAKSRNDRRIWETEKLDLDKNNPSGIWKTVKCWLGWGTSGTPSQIFWIGRVVSSPSGLAGAMNSFFLDKIKSLRRNIPLPTGDPASKLREAMANIQCQFSIKYVKEDEVLNPIPHGGRFSLHSTGGVNLTRTCLTASEGPAKHILCNII